MENIKISIVVPVYNVEPYLNRTIKSLLEQTIKEIEIILVDDESPDNCPALCNQYANNYPNIKVIHKKNGGLGMACNSGIEMAKGDYIAFCDSDDYVGNNMYETMYNAAIKYNADAVFTGLKTIDQNGKIRSMTSYTSLQVIKDKHNIYQFMMDMIASKPAINQERRVPMSAKVVLYRKDIIDRYNLRFVSERKFISEDLIWNMDILYYSNCIAILPYSGYYYYNNTSSLSKCIRTDRFYYFKLLREELFRKIKYYNIPEEAQTRIDRMFIGYSRFYIGNICTSNLPLKKKKNIVSTICKDKIWEDIWHSYPINEMPKIHYLMLYLMKHNCYSLISLIYKIR